MKNSSKRNYLSLDSSYSKNREPFKKLKIDKFSKEHQSSVNWHEVKIILDATVVGKYLNNKKSVSTIDATAPTNNEKSQHPGRNVLPCARQANEKSSNVFSQETNVMVKVEALEESLCSDHSEPKESFAGENVSIKQEEYEPVQDTNYLGNEFAVSISEDFQYQIDKRHTLSVERVAEGIFKCKGLESDNGYDEMSIGREFKHEELISNYENTECINEENITPSNVKSAPEIRRSRRKRKKRQDLDDYDYELVKKPRSYSRVNKKHTEEVSIKDSHSKSNSRLVAKANVPTVSGGPPLHKKKIKLYYCDHCDYKAAQKSRLPNHMKAKHLWLFSDNFTCKECGKSLDTKENCKVHRLHCMLQFLLKCKFCSSSVTTKREMEIHLRTAHIDSFRRQIDRKLVDKVWLDSIKELAANLKFDGNTKKLKYFGRRFLKVGKYYKAIEQSTQSSKKYYKCKMCGYEKTTKLELYKHTILMHINDLHKCETSEDDFFTCSKCGKKFSAKAGKRRFLKHEELCGISIRYFCKFCPMTFVNTLNLNIHICSGHSNKINSTDMGDVLDEIVTCRKMMKDANYNIFKEKIMRNTVINETKANSSYYLTGIWSLLKPVCLKCHAHVTFSSIRTQVFENCIECRTPIAFQCLLCDKNFTNYPIAWEHVNRSCQNRLFTLPVNKTNIDPDKTRVTVAKNVLLPYICDHCSYQTSYKRNLSRHMLFEHKKLSGDNLTCFRCKGNFDNFKKFIDHGCLVNNIYTCYFCLWASFSFAKVKKHVIENHSHHFRNKDGVLQDKAVDATMQRIVVESKIEKLGIRTYHTQSKIKRRFAEKMGLILFHCPTCDETVSKLGLGNKMRLVKHCPKCQSNLKMICKHCKKVYYKWNSITIHLNRNACNYQQANIPVHLLDHQYAIKSQSRAQNFNHED